MRNVFNTPPSPLNDRAGGKSLDLKNNSPVIAGFFIFGGMKKIPLLLLLFQVVCFGQQVDNVSIDSKIMGEKRELLVYTPFGYGEATDNTFDVFYVFDSQNRDAFDLAHSLLAYEETGGKSFIVVGIVSENRNKDMLPAQQTAAYREKWGENAGNADRFMAFLRNEAMPYLASRYRLGGTRIAVGHSNSAAFVLYTLMKDQGLFNDYIAISPNFANDEYALAKQFEAFDYSKLLQRKFVYVSHAAEETIKGWEIWKTGRERFYAFAGQSEALKKKLDVVVKSYPDEGHWSTYLPSLQNGLREYFSYEERVANDYSSETYSVTITVVVPDKDDVVFLTGNQPELGNWDPGKIQLIRKSDFVRELTLKLHSPALLKFTKGSWATEGSVKGFQGNIKIDTEETQRFAFEVLRWNG